MKDWVVKYPPQIWVVVPPNVHARSRIYRCIRSNHNTQVGFETREFYRIVNIERAIVEAFVYATKIGLANAVNAARIAVSSGQTTEAKLYEMATKLDAKASLLKHWEVFATL